MNHKLVVVLYFCVASVYSAPLQLPYLPMQYGAQPQLPFLRQMVPNMQTPSIYPQQQPLVIVLPNSAPAEADDRTLNLNEQITNANLRSNTGHIDENKDAVVVEANPKPETHAKSALVYLPDEGRFSLGQIISYIPFLPIEVNVPDTISWITHILTGGLFRPQGGMKTLPPKGQMPMIVMPYPGLMPGLNQ